MERLIELLNEFEKVRKSWWTYEWFDEYDGEFECKVLKTIFGLDDSFVCSKKYMFIKWLVDNEKIDVERVYNNSDYPMVKRDEFLYEWLLMLLSIQDEPIEFLVSILK